MLFCCSAGSLALDHILHCAFLWFSFRSSKQNTNTEITFQNCIWCESQKEKKNPMNKEGEIFVPREQEVVKDGHENCGTFQSPFFGLCKKKRDAFFPSWNPLRSSSHCHSRGTYTAVRKKNQGYLKMMSLTCLLNTSLETQPGWNRW